MKQEGYNLRVTCRGITITYIFADLLLFAFGYHVLRIRELGLYLFVVAIGLPASFAVVPASESVAPFFGWSLGSAAHVWSCAFLSIAVNIAIAAGIGAVVSAWRTHRRGAS
jgi:hypothetical protein